MSKKKKKALEAQQDGLNEFGDDSTEAAEEMPCDLHTRAHLRLLFKDPEGEQRGFPKDFAVKVIFGDGTSDDATVSETGSLVGSDGQPGIEVTSTKDTLTLEIAASDRYIVCESRERGNADDREKALSKSGADIDAASDLVHTFQFDGKPAAEACRSFRLPGTKWGLADSEWTVTNDPVSTWKAADHQFEKLGMSRIGTEAAPVVLCLDPRWMYAGLSYYDRVRKGDKQVSILPVILEGFAPDTGAEADVSNRVTRGSWTIGASPEGLLQCIPWILKAPDLAKLRPDVHFELRFKTKPKTYIHTPFDEAQPRVLDVGNDHDQPTHDRICFYDLPEVWRSKNWFVRKQPAGNVVAGGKFTFELQANEVRGSSPASPLIFSLDDIVLCEENGGKVEPVADLAAGEKLALFHHSFSSGTDRTDQGLYKPLAAVTTEGPQASNDANYPASKDEILKRYTPTFSMVYVKDYPDWTRLLLARGELYDCFSSRCPVDDAHGDKKKRVVGARAALRVKHAAAPFAAPAANASIHPRPATLRLPFLVYQPLLAIDRVDKSRRIARPPGGNDPRTLRKIAEWDPASRHASWAPGAVMGRFHMALIYCCDVDASEGATKEKQKAINFQYVPTFMDFPGGAQGAGAALTTDPAASANQKAYMKETIDHLVTRWNGPDGAFSTGQAVIEPRDAADKLTTSVVKMVQSTPLAQSAISIRVVVIDRAGMNSSGGVMSLNKSANKPATGASPGRLTSAHELGHATGHFDDYVEIWNHPSYRQPSMPFLVPGDPFWLDNQNGAEAMMMGNKVVQARYHWVAAEWMYAVTGRKYRVKYSVAGQEYTYQIDHHSGNTPADVQNPNVTLMRTYLQLPRATTVDAEYTPAAGGGARTKRFDAYLYQLGSDRYSDVVLPGACGGGAAPVDSLLVVALNMQLDWTDPGPKHTRLVSGTQRIQEIAKETFGFKQCAAFKAGTDIDGADLKLERCAIQIEPRVVVRTFSGDARYAEGFGIDTTLNAAGQKTAYEGKVDDLVGKHPIHLDTKIAASHPIDQSGLDTTTAVPTLRLTERTRAQRQALSYLHKLGVASKDATATPAILLKALERGVEATVKLRAALDTAASQTAGIAAMKVVGDKLSSLQAEADSQAAWESGKDSMLTDTRKEAIDDLPTGTALERATKEACEKILSTAEEGSGDAPDEKVFGVVKAAVVLVTAGVQRHIKRTLDSATIRVDAALGRARTARDGHTAAPPGTDAARNTARLEVANAAFGIVGGSTVDEWAVGNLRAPIVAAIGASVPATTVPQFYALLETELEKWAHAEGQAEFTHLSSLLDAMVQKVSTRKTAGDDVDALLTMLQKEIAHDLEADIKAYIGEWLEIDPDKLEPESYEKFAKAIKDVADVRMQAANAPPAPPPPGG